MKIVPTFETKRPRYRKSFSNVLAFALTTIFVLNIALSFRRVNTPKEGRKTTRFVPRSEVAIEKARMESHNNSGVILNQHLLKSSTLHTKKETTNVQIRNENHEVKVPKRTTSSFKSPKSSPSKEKRKVMNGSKPKISSVEKRTLKKLAPNTKSSPISRDNDAFAINATEQDVKFLEDKRDEEKDNEEESNGGGEKRLNIGKIVSDQTARTRSSQKKITEYLFKFENVTIDSLSKDHEHPEAMKRSLLRLQETYITRYVPWHAKTLRKVRRGDIKGRDVRVLLVQGKEGIGDRIRAIIHGYFLAVLSERVLLIDWEMPFPLDSVFSNNFTHDKNFFGMGSSSDYHTLRDFGNLARHTDLSAVLDDKKWVMLRKETRPDLRFMIQNMIHYYPNITALRRTANLLPEPAQEDFYPLIFQALFKLTPQFRTRIVRFVRINELDSPFVGIHLRLGWDTGEADTTKRFATNMTLEEIANCTADAALQMARARNINPPRFFLATDTSEIRYEVRKAILRKTNGTGKVIYGKWALGHIRQLLPLLKDDWDTFMNMFVDLVLLSQANSLVFMKSGFPKIARWMGAVRSHYTFACALNE